MQVINAYRKFLAQYHKIIIHIGSTCAKLLSFIFKIAKHSYFNSQLESLSLSNTHEQE